MYLNIFDRLAIANGWKQKFVGFFFLKRMYSESK